jgi:hypothetical protein
VPSRFISRRYLLKAFHLEALFILNQEIKTKKNLMKEIKSKEIGNLNPRKHNQSLNFDRWAFATLQVLAAFGFFRNSLTKLARQKLVGLSPAN